MRERDDERTENGRADRSGDAGRPAFIEEKHGRHGGSEESEGAPQKTPRTGESKWDERSRLAGRGDDVPQRDAIDRGDEYGHDVPDSVY